MVTELLTENTFDLYFPTKDGWRIKSASSSDLDVRETVAGSQIRCIDKRNGMTATGYRPETIPLGPSWLGAIDGLAAFYRGKAEERMASAVRVTEALGFRSAVHGDYLLGDMGCAFRRAWFEEAFSDLAPVSDIEWRILRKKLGIHKTDLYDTEIHPEGFVLNNIAYTTVFPDGGRYYPIDIWFAEMAGIAKERFLPVIVKCGELILGSGEKNLYYLAA